ncbi:MAG: efflux RND transporter periplasmic adaptor subunit [Magnetococcales bacterium]|nr:efflux RND transporter periplasmic adaptor subunit [Magnetococcales bacterium]
MIKRLVLGLWLAWVGSAWAQEGGGDAQIHLRGVVLPVNQSKLGFTQGGLVTELPAEGNVVRKNQLLARVNDSVPRQQMAKAKASLAAAQLKLTQAVHAQEKNKRLHAENILSDMALKEGEFAVTQGRIGVEQANSEVASATLAMEGTRLLAPFDGVVTRVTSHIGEWIGAGAPALELVDPANLELSMDLPPEQVTGVRPGTETAVFIDGRQAGTARARVVLPVVDAASGLRRVIWSITPAPDEVMTGRYVTLGRWGGKP